MYPGNDGPPSVRGVDDVATAGSAGAIAPDPGPGRQSAGYPRGKCSGLAGNTQVEVQRSRHPPLNRACQRDTHAIPEP